MTTLWLLKILPMLQKMCENANCDSTTRRNYFRVKNPSMAVFFKFHGNFEIHAPEPTQSSNDFPTCSTLRQKSSAYLQYIFSRAVRRRPHKNASLSFWTIFRTHLNKCIQMLKNWVLWNVNEKLKERSNFKSVSRKCRAVRRHKMYIVLTLEWHSDDDTRTQ